ncbi:MAG: hypothetical protein JNM75_07905 [Rhodospirillales bacterium]|nr:hypothetical protein [Rhodospirillales bacterium]
MNQPSLETDLLRNELEETLLNVIEDVVEAPADLITPLRLKVTEDDDGSAVLTVLRFEVRIDA